MHDFRFLKLHVKQYLKLLLNFQHFFLKIYSLSIITTIIYYIKKTCKNSSLFLSKMFVLIIYYLVRFKVTSKTILLIGNCTKNCCKSNKLPKKNHYCSLFIVLQNYTTFNILALIIFNLKPKTITFRIHQLSLIKRLKRCETK